jgi:predicted amidohydrolase YtcJ
MDMVFRGGRILTMNPAQPEVEAVAVRDGHIVAAGSSDEARAALGSSSRYEEVNLNESTLLPGFIDGHAHLSMFGMQLSGINLKELRSIREIQEAVARAHANSADDGWIRGIGYNDFFLAERRHPTRWDLDEVSPDRPVILTRTCGHIAAVNSVALRAAGIDEEEPNPPGGRYGRAEEGSLNGVLYDAALDRIQVVSRPSDEEMKTYLARGSQGWASAGITAFTDAGGPPGYLKVLTDAVEDGLVLQRVEAMVWNGLGVRQLDSFLPSQIRTGFCVGALCIGAAKVMVDGSSSGPTAATREGYAIDPQDHGILYMSLNELERTLGQAAEVGFQLTTHAVGDRAVEFSVRAISRVGVTRRRNRIEHCAMCAPDLIPPMKDATITPVGQARFLYEFGDGYVVNYGEERGAHMFPFRSWIDAGLRPVGSSDSPVADYRPLRGMAAAMDRTTQGGRVLAPEECITVEEALAMYTTNAAWVSHREGEVGMIKPGFRADLAVVGGDVTRLSPSGLAEAPVRLTLIGGEVMWHNDMLG